MPSWPLHDFLSKLAIFVLIWMWHFWMNFRAKGLLRRGKTSVRDSQLRLHAPRERHRPCGSYFQHLRAENAHERRQGCFQLHPASPQKWNYDGTINYSLSAFNGIHLHAICCRFTGLEIKPGLSSTCPISLTDWLRSWHPTWANQSTWEILLKGPSKVSRIIWLWDCGLIFVCLQILLWSLRNWLVERARLSRWLRSRTIPRGGGPTSPELSSI